jgi:hypothetical protein
METKDTQKIITGWEKQKTILKAKFERLTDANLDFEESRKNEMVCKLAFELGMSPREIKSIISSGH